MEQKGALSYVFPFFTRHFYSPNPGRNGRHLLHQSPLILRRLPVRKPNMAASGLYSIIRWCAWIEGRVAFVYRGWHSLRIGRLPADRGLEEDPGSSLENGNFCGPGESSCLNSKPSLPVSSTPSLHRIPPPTPWTRCLVNMRCAWRIKSVTDPQTCRTSQTYVTTSSLGLS